MLLFDMRNISSNSVIPVSVAETMTDIVLEKMRESSSSGSTPIRVVIAPIVESGGGLIERIIGDGVLSSNPNDHAVVVLDRDVPGLRWHEVKLERTDDTREEVMRKIEEAIEAVVKATTNVNRPSRPTRPKESDAPDNVQEAVSGAIAENIAIFALDNSVAGPGQVLRIRPVPDRNSLEAEIGGAEIEVPVPIPVEAVEAVTVDVAEALAEAVGEEDRRTRLTETVKGALAEILDSSSDEEEEEEERFQLDLPQFGISVTATGEGESAQDGSGDKDPFGVQFGDDLFSVPEFGFTVDTTTTTEEVPERKGIQMGTFA